MRFLVATADDVPRVDKEKPCRVSKKKKKEVSGNTETANTFQNCMEQEKANREQLLKDWRTYTAAAKVRCVQPSAYMANYTEWLTCLEMDRDAARMRLESPDPSVPVQPRSRRR